MRGGMDAWLNELCHVLAVTHIPAYLCIFGTRPAHSL